MTISQPAVSHGRPDPRPPIYRVRRRARILGIALLPVVVLATGCSNATPSARNSGVGVGANGPVLEQTTTAPVEAATSASKGKVAARAGTPYVAPYTGAPANFTVPAGMSIAHILIRGADGGNWNYTANAHNITVPGGHGQELTLDVPVSPGQVITAAVAGTGETPNGISRQSNGGWSLNGYQGGSGGGSPGHLSGAAGGGATVVELDGSVIAVAAGGGGAAWARTSTPTAPGGAGGVSRGDNGNGSTPGLGGSSANPKLNRLGGSVTNVLDASPGGGGGGGGYYGGGGGGTDSSGSGSSGGGGSSWTAPGVALAQQTQTVTSGYFSIDFAGGTASLAPSGTTWQISSTSKTGKYLLEVNGANTADGASVDTWTKTPDAADPSKVAAHQLWTFKAHSGWPGLGELINVQSGKCLEINGTTNRVDQWPCAMDSLNHMWRVIGGLDGTVRIVSGTDDALSTGLSGANNGTRVILQEPTSAIGTTWTLTAGTALK